MVSSMNKGAYPSPQLSKKKTVKRIANSYSNVTEGGDIEWVGNNAVVVKEDIKKHNNKMNAEKHEDKSLKDAILTKSYPRSFIVLCLVFYLVIFMTFVSQLIMKSRSESTMNDLQVKKNLLKYSQERSYMAGLIEINAIAYVYILRGVLETSGAAPNLTTGILNLQSRIEILQDSNKKMLDYVFSLDKDIQEQLFAEDVRIYGTYLDSDDATVRYVNTFEFSDKTTNAVKALTGLKDASSEAGLHIFSYLQNILADDFLYKSAKISEILTQSVEEQKKSFENVTNSFLILNPFLLAGIGILLVGIIWNQYRIGKENMKAFIKIPSKGVQIIADRLAQFRINLINEESFSNGTASWVSSRTNNTAQNNEQSLKKVYENHKIEYKLFLRRYYKYIARVIACISPLVAITIWDLLQTQQAIKVIYNRQSQVQYAYYISNRATVAYIAEGSLFVTNNTLIVEHKYPEIGTEQGIEEIKQILSDIPKKFLETDGTYNPEVKNILFGNNAECKGFPTGFTAYCKAYVAEGPQVNLISAITVYQDVLVTKWYQYKKVNKSELKNLVAIWSAARSPLPSFGTMTPLAEMVAEIMDKSLTDKIEELQRFRDMIIIIFSVGLVLVGVVIWFYIFKVVREVYNDFKKVLQIFPSNLVLSSYLVKRFLLKTSNERKRFW